MKRSLVGVLLAFSTLLAYSQCLTDFSKLVPEPSVDASTGFGNSISMFDNYLAIGIPYSDSLGRATGIVHIYKLTGTAWQRIAAMAPSDPVDGMRFGITVKLSRDYLIVGAQTTGGKVYMFKKGAGDWSSTTQLTSFNFPATSYFGILTSNCLSMSADQQTLVITDPYYRTGTMPLSRSGGIFIYHKNAMAEWNGSITPSVLTSPEDDCIDFGMSGVSIYGNTLVTATPYAPTGIGRIYVYSDVNPGFQNPTLEAKLDPGSADPFDSYLFGNLSLVQTNDGIFINGVSGLQTAGRFGILFFEKPASGTWIDSTSPTCFIEPKSTVSNNAAPFIITSNGTDLFASVRDTQGKGYFSIIRKGATGWCDPAYELIDQSEPPPAVLTNNYAQVHAINQHGTTAAIGFVSHPDNANSLIALKVLTKTGSVWDSQKLFPTKKSTAGHNYGNEILGFDDFLFVTASRDGSVKPNAGAVYSYKKVGTGWQKTGKILPPLGQSKYDDVFGTALASNKTYLAVGAAGHEPKGKIFMYKKNASDWSSVDLVQEITIPEAGLTVYAYGDNLAMDDNWLIVPYVQNSPARIILAIFKFNGATWDFKQVAEVGNGNIFAKESTLDVAIENGIIVAANNILELNASGVWELKHTLYPSDPEPMRISPDFTHWVSNGALFGHSVDIHENTIFIGAPQRDYEGTWDVGAVYVYVKQPHESWSSRTETVKLVPRIKDENELFGYSVKALLNTVIIGAPGSDYTKANLPRNKPGRAYVFQAEDYLWQNVTPLIDFTGDSFQKDYYGMSVHMDETDFFIGATIEDIETGKLSGAVYVTPTPPLLKLVPPVCQSGGLIDLFGYPFGGTWAGPGIINATEGIIDPTLIEPGEKIYTYITPSCAYPGKLKIKIEPPVLANLLVNTDQLVCASASVNRVLSVQTQPDCNYQWYYRENSSHPFAPTGSNAATLAATRRGEYQVKVFNQTCQTFSPVITIKDEVIDLTLTPVNPVCTNLTTNIPLVATPAGGQWTGPGVTNNVIRPQNLLAGQNELIYRYTSTNLCKFQKSMEVIAQQPFIPVIKSVSGDLCEEGLVKLGVEGTIPHDLNLTWYEKPEQSTDFQVLHENTATITVTNKGPFRVQATDLVCDAMSEPLLLNMTLDLTLTPHGNAFEICGDDSFELSFDHTPGNQYQWLFTETAGEIPDELVSEQSQLIIQETGYYKAIVTRGVCVLETEPKYVFIQPSDSIFVPNVFTPNGDSRNDRFRVVTNKTGIFMNISNRNGKTIFNSSDSSGWDGGDAPSGIYYWFVSYHDCHDRLKTLKGWVHLIR